MTSDNVITIPVPEGPVGLTPFLTPEQRQELRLADYEDSDAGKAEALVALFPGAIVYTNGRGWGFHSGTHYEFESEGSEFRVATMCEQILNEMGLAVREAHERRANEAIARNENPPRRPSLASYKRDDRKIGSIMGRPLKARVGMTDNDFNQHDHLLNAANGVIDLRTGQLLDREEVDDRFTYCVPNEYNPTARSAEFEQFLVEVLPDPEVREFLQVVVGYSITGSTREEKMFYLHGPSRSGKSTLTMLVSKALGGSPLVEHASYDLLTRDRKYDSNKADLASLKEARLVISSESSRTERINEAMLKNVTGREKIQAALKYKDMMQFEPAFKLWYTSNFAPNADPDDPALWGRLVVINFPVSFLGREDKTLKDRLSTPEVLQAILTWAVEGARMYYELGERGLRVPDFLNEYKEAMRYEQDFVAQFIDECFDVNVDGERVASADLHSVYELWCKENGVPPKLIKSFSVGLSDKGFEKYMSNGRAYWRGLRLSANGHALVSGTTVGMRFGASPVIVTADVLEF